MGGGTDNPQGRPVAIAFVEALDSPARLELVAHGRVGAEPLAHLKPAGNHLRTSSRSNIGRVGTACLRARAGLGGLGRSGTSRPGP